LVAHPVKGSASARRIGDETYYTRFEEADDAANKVSQRPEAHSRKGAHSKSIINLAGKVVTYKRSGIDYMEMTSMCQENKDRK
jgi:hypothetical protein